MKIGLLIFLFFIGMLSVKSQSIDVFNADRFKGKVKSVVQYEWQKDSLTNAREINRTFFDEEGFANRAERERGSALKSVLLTYNDVGDLEKECYFSDGDTTYKHYYYDNENRLVKKEFQTASESQPNFVIEYDYHLNRVTESKFYANRVFCDLKETYLNIEGQDSVIVKKNKNGKELNYTTYTYADSGRYTLIESRKGKNGAVNYYSERFQLSDTIFVDSTYDKNGNLLDNVQIVSYAFNETAYMKFDVIAEDLHDESYYNYTFDSQGNWITQIAYLHDEFWFMRKRELTYYD